MVFFFYWLKERRERQRERWKEEVDSLNRQINDLVREIENWKKRSIDLPSDDVSGHDWEYEPKRRRDNRYRQIVSYDRELLAHLQARRKELLERLGSR